jgi:putative Holliday junction resolvase
MRFLAIDLGDRRTGIAVGDDVIGLVQPRTVLMVPKGDRLLDAVLAEIADYGPDALVVGLPLNMDDSEGPAVAAVRAFVATLAQRVKVPIHLQDERLSSFAAEGRLAGTGRTRQEKKELRDALAAAEFLRDFLTLRNAPPASAEDDPDRPFALGGPA